jgi:3-hydroxyisobutyrate dehydrogenase-like beta-hydroxyacid dehydrogenase
MSIECVAVVSTGDMGHAVARALRRRGLGVVTCLAGRSERTRALAKAAGAEEVPDLPGLVTRADVFLSIVPPTQAEALAREVAAALRATGKPLLYVDCNAVSPWTTRRIGDTITDAGGRYVDGGIVGPPPERAGTTRFYLSGPAADDVLALNGGDVEFLAIGSEVGDASALKMCYAAISKGTAAIWFESLIAAEALNVADVLWQELARSQAGALPRLEQQIPGIPPKALRWAGEMEEISATFAALGMTPRIFEGAGDIWKFVGTTPLADAFPENADRTRPVQEIMAALRACLGAVSRT